MTTPERTAIFIDPVNRTVSSVPYDGTLSRFTELTGAGRIEAMPVINAGAGGRFDDEGYYIEGDSPFDGYQHDDSILFDEDAMFVDDCHFFRFPLCSTYVAGPVLIAGIDQDGKSFAPGITAAELEKHITWFGMNPV